MITTTDGTHSRRHTLLVVTYFSARGQEDTVTAGFDFMCVKDRKGSTTILLVLRLRHQFIKQMLESLHWSY